MDVEYRGRRFCPNDRRARFFSFLIAICAVALPFIASAVAAADARLPEIKVALYLDAGCKGGGVIHLAQLLRSSPDVMCDFLDAADVQAGKLGGYDVLVMPGGSGYDRYSQLREEGFEKIRKYIREGGSYCGICAGIAMALNDPKRLRLIPYTREKNPLRGGFSAAVMFNARAEALFGIPAGTRYFRYHDGPIPAKGDPVPDSEYEVLATFESHVMQKGKSVTPMYGMPAVIYGRYGKGKVLVSVMHPEYFPSTHDVLGAGFKPLAGRSITFTYPRKLARPLRVTFYAGEIDRTGDTRKVVEDALALLTDCTGYAGSAGGSLKGAIAADRMLAFAVEKAPLSWDRQTMYASFVDAFLVLDTDRAEEFPGNLENIEWLIDTAVNDYDAVAGLFEDSGTTETMAALLSNPDALTQWNALDGLLSELVKWQAK